MSQEHSPATHHRFIDARIEWLRKRGAETTLPYPTRDELAAFADGFAAASIPSETACSELAVQELRNIVNADRFNGDHFDDDTSFADWATSRCRFTLEKIGTTPSAIREISLGGWAPRLYGSDSPAGSLGPFGLTVHVDKDMPDDVMEFRDGVGRVLITLVNVGRA